MIEAKNITKKYGDKTADDQLASSERPTGPGAGRRAALAAAVLISIVVVFQWALACGAPWGQYTQGGGVVGQLPAAGRAIALVSSALLMFMTVAVLARAGLGPMRSTRRWIVSSAAWLSAAYFGLAVLLNLATPSGTERLIWLPVSVAIWALVGMTIWSTRVSSTPDFHSNDTKGTAA